MSREGRSASAQLMDHVVGAVEGVSKVGRELLGP